MPDERLQEIDEALLAMGVEPVLVEEDESLLVPCGETVLHIQTLGSRQAPYVRARNLMLADVVGDGATLRRLAEENVGSPAPVVFEREGGVVRVGGVVPDTRELGPAIPSWLWAIAHWGERRYDGLQRALGSGVTWAEAERESQGFGDGPPEVAAFIRRPAIHPERTPEEARHRIDEIIAGFEGFDETIRLGDGHHALRVDDATVEVGVAPRPFAATFMITTRVVGRVPMSDGLAHWINRQNGDLGWVRFAWMRAEETVACITQAPGPLVEPEAFGPLLDLHAALVRAHTEELLAEFGGVPALIAQAG